MGFISRKLFPACESMCVCCPALRSRSRQPVKRYKKLLSEIFPKSIDGIPNERKIVKLCEYGTKNPLRLPKIAKYLEERCYKELRCEHIQFVKIVAEVYNKLLCLCKDQMAYFAVNLLNVVTELLENSKQDAVQIFGCQILTRFIYAQVDGTYTYNIENFTHKICTLASRNGEELHKNCLRASGLQCLSAMVWFMAEFSHMFVDFDKIVQVVLENYDPDRHNDINDERGEPHHNWVDEVLRCEGRGTGAGSDFGPSCTIIRPPVEKKDPSFLTREEMENPKVWAQICVQRMIELAMESTTLRRVVDPMLAYFDIGQHWIPPHGLALVVLSDMSYFMETPGSRQLILAAVIHHLDHKNISHDPQTKSYVIQTATALTRQIRSGASLTDIGIFSDLCRHLRKSLQASLELPGGQESNLNISLQSSVENCLIEIAKGVADTRPLYDSMAITLEKVPCVGTVARATMGSLRILAHTISLASVSSHSHLVFPEALLVQLLKVMLHPDVETRIGAHQIFSVLLLHNSNCQRYDVLNHKSRWHSNTASASASASITALLEKLRKERDGSKEEKDGKNVLDAEEELNQGIAHKNSPSYHKIKSIIDRKAGSTNLSKAEPHIMKFTEDQIAQLLSAIWMQANLPDNTPSSIEAIAHSFCLILISSRLANPNDNLVIRFFQLPLSLWSTSLDPNNGALPPAYQRSLLTSSIAMLMFAMKIYQISELNDLLRSLALYDVDPYVGITNEFQVYVKPADVREYCTFTNNQVAASFIFETRDKMNEFKQMMLDILVQNLSGITKLEADYIVEQLSEMFTPDDAFMFGPQLVHNLNHMHAVSHSKESLSFDGELPANSLVEDDTTSEFSVADVSRFIPKMPPSPCVSNNSNIISIGQLLESALEVAGQVAGTSVSTSPLPYSTMASQCEALGMGTRKKLSSWLTHESYHKRAAADKRFPASPADGLLAIRKITNEGGGAVSHGAGVDPWLALRLPPASPFDNFIRAARC